MEKLQSQKKGQKRDHALEPRNGPKLLVFAGDVK